MPNTERLFYADPYQREFSARIVLRAAMAGQPAVALDCTAFYPTGGGQPHDTGSLRPATWTADEPGVSVTEVVAEDGLIWHILSAPSAGTKSSARSTGRDASTTCSSTPASTSCRRRLS